MSTPMQELPQRIKCAMKYMENPMDLAYQQWLLAYKFSVLEETLGNNNFDIRVLFDKDAGQYTFDMYYKYFPYPMTNFIKTFNCTEKGVREAIKYCKKLDEDNNIRPKTQNVDNILDILTKVCDELAEQNRAINYFN